MSDTTAVAVTPEVVAPESPTNTSAALSSVGAGFAAMHLLGVAIIAFACGLIVSALIGRAKGE